MSSRSSPSRPAASRFSKAVCLGDSLRAVLVIPVRHLHAPAVPAADRFNRVGKRKHFNVSADGPLTDPKLYRQVLYCVPPPLAKQIQDLLPPVIRAHAYTPSLASMPRL